MNTDFNFKIGNTTYTTQELKTALDGAKANFDNWSGARKIKLAGVQADKGAIESKEFKYNEILKAVSNAIHERKSEGDLFTEDSLTEGEGIKFILRRIRELEGAGHEDTSFLYTLFRRIIPNMFRGRDLSNLDSKVKSLYPDKDTLINNVKEYLNKNKIESQEGYRKLHVDFLCSANRYNLSVDKYVLMVDYLTRYPDTLEWDILKNSYGKNFDNPAVKMMMVRFSSKELIFGALDQEQLGNYAGRLLDLLGRPLKVECKELNNESYVQDLFFIYNLLTPEKRGEILPGITAITNKEDGIFAVIEGSEHNLSVIVAYNLAKKNLEGDIRIKRRNFSDEILNRSNPLPITAVELVIAFNNVVYIEDAIFKFYNKLSDGSVEKKAMSDRAIEEAEWVQEQLRTIPKQIYKDFQEKLLSEKNIIFKIDHVAILVDYFQKQEYTEEQFEKFIAIINKVGDRVGEMSLNLITDSDLREKVRGRVDVVSQ